jgi:hypothetical protein
MLVLRDGHLAWARKKSRHTISSEQTPVRCHRRDKWLCLFVDGSNREKKDAHGMRVKLLWPGFCFALQPVHC